MTTCFARPAWCAALLMLLCICIPCIAQAQSCRSLTDGCDEGQAYAAAMAYGQSVVVPGYAACAVKSDSQTFVGGRIGEEQACTSGNLRIVQSFYFKTPCSARSEEYGWEGDGTAATVSACHNGCLYTSTLDPAGVVGQSFWPTGAVCTESDAPAPTPAGDNGGEDGGGTGGETGGGDSGGNDGGGTGGDTGSGGGNGGGGNGNGDGDGVGDGDGSGDGGGDGGVTPGPGDGDGPGSPAPSDGKFYTKSEKTMEKVYKDFHDKIEKTELVGGVKKFMQVPGGGSCPVFTVPASRFWNAMTLDFHCSGTFLALLKACGYVILAIAAYAAVRIALT